MKMHQPIYINKEGMLESISTEVFLTYEEARKFGTFVGRRNCTVDVIELNLEGGKGNK